MAENMRFTVLKDFSNEEFGDYVAGMTYEARDGDDRLKELIPEWIEQGLVREGGPEAQISGGGEVTDAERKG